MSIIYLSRKITYLKFVLVSITLTISMALLMVTFSSRPALAADVGDVVGAVINSNFTNGEYMFDHEDRTGYDFPMCIGGGDYGSGVAGITILGPIKPNEIEILLDYVSSVSDHTNMQTTPLKGCEVREYTMFGGAGIGVVLPDYFLTVEIYETGRSNQEDIRAAKGIAQQALDGLEKAGLLSQKAPDIIKDKPIEKAAPKGESGTYFPEGMPSMPCDCDESPAGVGSVGNIPAPSNATEAVVGVAVPGIIATSLGALAGIGGGGFTPPTSGAPIYPGGSPSTGPGGAPGASQTTFPNLSNMSNGIGYRRRDELGASDVAWGGFYDTEDMRTPPGNLKIDFEENVSEFLPPSPSELGIQGEGREGYLGENWKGFYDTEDMRSHPDGFKISIDPKSGMLIDGPEEAAILKPLPEILIDTEDMRQVVPAGDLPEIFIDTTDMLENQIPINMPIEDMLIETKEEGMNIFIDPALSSSVAVGSADLPQEEIFFSRAEEDIIDTSAWEKVESEIYDSEGFDREGFDAEGFDKAGFDKEGYNAEGYDVEGFDRAGYDKKGFDREGRNSADYDSEGYNSQGYDENGFDRNGFDKDGYNAEGYNAEGFDREGFDAKGFDKAGFDKEGYNADGYNADGFDREGFDAKGFDSAGFDKEGYNADGIDREGYNKAGFDADGYDREGFNNKGYDREGYGKNGFDSEGFDRDGYNINGYDRQGYNKQGFDAQGYDKNGFDKNGFDKKGWDQDGYDKNGFNKDGWDREGFDKKGYDAEGYDRDGFNREGQSKEGLDADGYDKKGFNEHGYDRDGYDRDGFNYEGYNRGGRDPWGYDKQGYDKDGYHWSGYNADGYDKKGRHWTENPYLDDGPKPITEDNFRNPFTDDRDIKVTIAVETDERGTVIGGRRLADDWEAEEPPLGKPYPKTAEKYGAKEWGDTIPDEPEIPIPPQDKAPVQLDPDDLPAAKDKPSLEYGSADDPASSPEGEVAIDLPPAPGPQHGDTVTLPGKDGVDYPLVYNGETGDWENLMTGGKVKTEELEDYIKGFNRWQDDLAEDKRWAADAIEKMKNREDAHSKAVDQEVADWNRLDKMQEAVRKHNIGESGDRGNIDRAVQDLKDDILAGKKVDQDRVEQLSKIIRNRVSGASAEKYATPKEEDWFDTLGYALEANLATTKEVITGQKEDGSISWKGMAARIMLTAATGGGASLTTAAGEITRMGAVDGVLTVSEAMLRIKDSIDKDESDFRAVSKALGIVVLSEQASWLAGKGLGAANKAMLEKFPAFTNNTANAVEKALLKASAQNQIWSQKLGILSKSSAEEALDQINKQLVNIGGEEAAKGIMKQAAAGKLVVANSFEDVSKAGGGALAKGVGAKSAASSYITDVAGAGGPGTASAGDIASSTAGGAVTGSIEDAATSAAAKGAGKAAVGSTDNVAKGVGKAAAGSTDDVAKGAGRAAAGSTDDVAKGAGKTATGSTDDIAKGVGKAATDSTDDLVKGAGKAATGSTDDVAKGAGKTATGSTDDVAKGASKGVSSSTDDVAKGATRTADELPLNRNPRTAEEVLSDPASMSTAQKNVQDSMKDFDNLPPAKQNELVKEQALYNEYRNQAQTRTENLVDKVQKGEDLTVKEIMEMKSDPASMRNLKELNESDSIAKGLSKQEAEGIQSQFNKALDDKIHKPAYGEVESYLAKKYPGMKPDEVRCRSVRTPGSEQTPYNINTDNDVIAERLVNGPNGPEWVEIPRGEWEDVYYKAFADRTDFSLKEAQQKFPQTNWKELDKAAQHKQWASHHEEGVMDQFAPDAGRDFSSQRTWRLDGDRPMVEASPEEIARGVETVTIDGKEMRPSTGYELAQRGEGTLLDAEQLALMEKHKVGDYWNKGNTPAEVMRNQTEALEQLRKTANLAQNVEKGYRNMGYKIADMPTNMQEAIKVINNKDLSPATRVTRLQELGYRSPDDFLEKISSRIGAIRTAPKK